MAIVTLKLTPYFDVNIFNNFHHSNVPSFKYKKTPPSSWKWVILTCTTFKKYYLHPDNVSHPKHYIISENTYTEHKTITVYIYTYVRIYVEFTRKLNEV